MATLVWGAGSASGMDGDWNTAANWTGDTLPANGDSVIFNGTAMAPCTIGATTPIYLNTITVAASNSECAWGEIFVPGASPFDTGYYYYPYHVYCSNLNVGLGSLIPIISIDSTNYTFGNWVIADPQYPQVGGVKPVVVIDNSISTETITWNSYSIGGNTTGCLGWIAFVMRYDWDGAAITSPSTTVNISFTGKNFNLMPSFSCSAPLGTAAIRGILRKNTATITAGNSLIANIGFAVFLGSATTLVGVLDDNLGIANSGTTSITCTFDYEYLGSAAARMYVIVFAQISYVKTGAGNSITVSDLNKDTTFGGSSEAWDIGGTSAAYYSQVAFIAPSVYLNNCNINFSDLPSTTMMGVFKDTGNILQTGGKAYWNMILVQATTGSIELIDSTVTLNNSVIGNSNSVGYSYYFRDTNPSFFGGFGVAMCFLQSWTVTINLRGTAFLKHLIAGSVTGSSVNYFGYTPPANTNISTVNCYDQSVLYSYCSLTPILYSRSAAHLARMFSFAGFNGPSFLVYMTLDDDATPPLDQRSTGNSF